MSGARGVVTLTVNGRLHTVDAAPATPLLAVLRESLGLVGTRLGCGLGGCGACRVLVDGRPASSCDLPVSAVEGREVTTVEGLPPQLAAAFVAEQAAQCGYCSSGMLIATAALLRRNPHPQPADVAAALDDQLCRCGAHPRIVRAVLRAAAGSAAAPNDGGRASGTPPLGRPR